MANTNTFVTTDDLNTAISVVKASIPARSQGLTQSDVIALIKSNAPNSTGTGTTVKTTTATANLNGLTVTFTRMGNMVVASGSGNLTTSTPSFYNAKGLVPSGYRPNALANINLGYINGTSTANMGFTFVYPSGDLWSSTAASTTSTIVYSISGWWITSDTQPS